MNPDTPALPDPAPGPRLSFSRDTGRASAARDATRATGGDFPRTSRRRLRRLRLAGVSLAVSALLALWGVMFSHLLTARDTVSVTTTPTSSSTTSTPATTAPRTSSATSTPSASVTTTPSTSASTPSSSTTASAAASSTSAQASSSGSSSGAAAVTTRQS